MNNNPDPRNLTPGPVIIWRFRDGKPGHENQTAGLLAALQQRVPLQVIDIACPGPFSAWLYWLRGRFPPGSNQPAPALLIGAGHATHVPMLAARRARGGRSIVLMKPSLPLRWFDLCVVPEHDRVRSRPNVMRTLGVLNRIRPAAVKDAALGLLLIGGPSRHHGWNEAGLLEQIVTLIARQPELHWQLSTSRRTPAGFINALRARLTPAQARRVDCHDWQALAPGWLPEQLALAHTVWVTEDSVSMLYEALTAGAATGVLKVPRKGAGRVIQGLEQLINEQRVVTYQDWLQGSRLVLQRQPLDEASRVAEEILRRWPVDA